MTYNKSKHFAIACRQLASQYGVSCDIMQIHGQPPYLHEWAGKLYSDDDFDPPADSAIEAAYMEYQWAEIRKKRDKLLAESDWTQMPDSPLDAKTKSKWANYRRKLRELPNNGYSPDKLKWPSLSDTEYGYDYNKSTGKYHQITCQHCGTSLDIKTLAELRTLNATPCIVCNPPTFIAD